ncbi:spermatogenesis-associated protein 33 isoform X1 [Vicugna pacos]|uniref:Spermatogenesis-associated protein 33 isoform X1 n=2 Tax=Vicugna pacos TaxID=30538 RepID=A0A6J3A0R0_VICPA|nr:spermatogenesis-associated protein 33 [Vicugna pacos]
MGLSKSKRKPGKGEESKNERSMDRPCQEPEKPRDVKPAESLLQKKEAAERQWPSSEVEEKPDIKSEKKVAVPQIVITKASKETLVSTGSVASQEQRTIWERAAWGPYYRHRNPSTVDAYTVQTTE